MSGMTTSAPHRRYTIAEFVELEAYANVRHEFLDGQIYAMAGGTPVHGTYAANVIALISAQLGDKPCRVQTSDVRIRVQATGLDTYPDASVVCGKAERDSDDENAIVNPIVLVEILSESTAAYDLGDKLVHYKQIPALREVLFVDPSDQSVSVMRRDTEGSWTTHRAARTESIELQSIECRLAVDAVFRDPLAD